MGEPEPVLKTPEEARKAKVVQLTAQNPDLIKDIDDIVIQSIARNVHLGKDEARSLLKKKPFGGQSICDLIAITVAEQDVYAECSFSITAEFTEKAGQLAAKSMEHDISKLKGHNKYLSVSVEYSEGAFRFVITSDPPKDKEIKLEESEINQ